MNILVSACLLGMNCRYDGIPKESKAVMECMEKYNLIPVCPEIYGGLMTPRPPAEKQGDRVINMAGEDVTEQYNRGAQEALKMAEIYNCKYAILKQKSPSCGCGVIYDGTFSGKLIPGDGVTARLLKENGIIVLGENDSLDCIKQD